MEIIGPVVDILAPVFSGIAATIGLIGKGIQFIKPILVAAAIAAGILGSALLIASITAASLTAFLSGGLGIGLSIAAALAGIGFITSQVGDAQNVKDGIAPPSKGPFTITDSFGATAITAKRDGLAVSPNISRENMGSGLASTAINPPLPPPSLSIAPNIIREENRNNNPTINYDQLADAIAMGAEKGASRANISTNLDGSKVSNRIQAPLAMNTRKYSV